MAVDVPTTEAHGGATNGARTTLTVAVTGASGTVGPSLLRRLASSEEIAKVVAIGRRHTDEMRRHAKVTFHQADVRDADAVRASVEGADVVVHLAFSLYGVRLGEQELFETNVLGTVNVARAAVQSGARRFVYTSSAAVYGRGGTESHPLPEDAPMHAPARLFYARHKAQAEFMVHGVLEGSDTQAFIFRPCGVAGPSAAGELAHQLPSRARDSIKTLARLAAAVRLRPALPAPPVPLQFVHEDDVAQAVAIAVGGDAPPGIYNLAGAGAVSGGEALRLLGLRPLPLPPATVSSSLDLIARVPLVIPALGWPELVREPLLLDTSKAMGELGWSPRFSTRRTLRATRKAIGW